MVTFTESEKQKIKEDYLGGSSTSEIAIEMHVSPSKVQYHIRQMGIGRQKVDTPEVTEELVDSWVHRYCSCGESIYSIAHDNCPFSSTTVRYHLKARGILLRPSNCSSGYAGKLNNEAVGKLKELFNYNCSSRAIAYIMQISNTTVCRYLVDLKLIKGKAMKYHPTINFTQAKLIKQAMSEGKHTNEIANELGIDKLVMENIIHTFKTFKTGRHLPIYLKYIEGGLEQSIEERDDDTIFSDIDFVKSYLSGDIEDV